MEEEFIGHLTLPSENAEQWAIVEKTLSKQIQRLAELDDILTFFGTQDREPRVCTFFSKIPGSPDAGIFDFGLFFDMGVPLLVQVALEMPVLFANRPANVQLNDFRFTVVDLFMGTAVSPNSATTFLNFFVMLGKYGIPDDLIHFERLGYRKGPPPWDWEHSGMPLCKVSVLTGSIDDSPADLHVEFANAFVGGGVMTGDAAMEETLFLVKPELMVAMAIENRMVDEEAVRIDGARKYSVTTGYGQEFRFGGECTKTREGREAKVCAIDAVRGGGPAMTEAALLRDMNKARIAFEGAKEIATGGWGCGAYGNNHDLMFWKQWLAASDAGCQHLYYHDFGKNQSHHIVPLIRRLGHLTVGEAWMFLQDITKDLRKPHNMTAFCERIADIAVGKLKVPLGRHGK